MYFLRYQLFPHCSTLMINYIKLILPRSVFVTAQPLKISLHNFYEFVWLLKTGIPRMLRILAGNEPFIHDSKILSEGYQHYTP